jgi:hypothetical protein
MADIKIKLGIDAAGLQQGSATAKKAVADLVTSSNKKGLFQNLKADISKIGGQMGGITSALTSGNLIGAAAGIEGMVAGMGALAIPLAVAVSGIAAVTVAANGMWNAMNRSKELVMVSENFGTSVSTLMTVQNAFEKVGLSAQDAEASYAKLATKIEQAQTGQGKAAQYFKKLGIDPNQLGAMTDQMQQLRMVGEAISKMGTGSEKAAASKFLLGGARQATALAPEQQARSAKATASIGDLFSQYGDVFMQFQGQIRKLFASVADFWAGAASQVIPELTAFVDGIEKLDLVGAGKAFGAWVRSLMDDIQIWKTLFTEGWSAAKKLAQKIEAKGEGVFTPEQQGIAKMPVTEVAANVEPMPIGAAVDISSTLSSLAKVGGASGGIGGGIVQDQAAWQSVRIQESILDYAKQLLEVVKGGNQDLGITPSGGGMVLSA